MSLSELHTFGFDKEDTLKKRIEEVIGETCTKTKERFAQFDYNSNDFYIELKSRRKTDNKGRPLLPDTNDTWLLPTSKIPKDNQKDAVYFYYFEADNSLWFLQYEEELFNTFERQVPYWHPSRQEHFYIPIEAWTKVVE